MRVIYHCYGRAHSSVVASHLHLGTLPLNGPIAPEQIMALPEFDRAEADDFGEPYFMGRDEAGNEVYILGLNSQAPLCVRAILNLAGHLGLADRIILVNTLPAIGLTTRLGGFISKKLRCPGLGKPLAARGIIQALPRLRQLVRIVIKETAGKGQAGQEEAYPHDGQ
ncbi:MAG: DUF3189 family protein [Firmicutes bacterium]|nr:DUF3189 family protein [Bacillota bacterium]